SMRTSTPSRGTPSYTTPLPVSVMPYVVTTFVGREGGGAAPPSTIVRNSAASIRRNAVATSDTSVAPSRAAVSTAPASKPSCTTNGVDVYSARVTTPSPPTCASGMHANHVSLSGSTYSRSLVANADAATASWVSTTPFGSPVVPLVATTSASPSSTGASIRIDASNRAAAARGRRGSTGSTASPASHARRSDSTKATPCASTARRRRTEPPW